MHRSTAMPLKPCPVCGRRFDLEQSPAPPFCSDRCRLIDLGRWASESYSVPHVPDDEEELDEQPPSADEPSD